MVWAKTGKKLSVPYVDVPAGGYGDSPGTGGDETLWGDAFPWYYDEGPKPKEGTKGFNANSHIDVVVDLKKDTFQMTDAPTVVKRNATVSFKTWLVVLNDKSEPTHWIAGVSWQFVQKDGKPSIANMKRIEDKPTAMEFNKANQNSGFTMKLN
jgi:hypothetical protein